MNSPFFFASSSTCSDFGVGDEGVDVVDVELDVTVEVDVDVEVEVGVDIGLEGDDVFTGDDLGEKTY